MVTTISLGACARTPAARRGMQHTRTLLKAIQRHNRRSIKLHGDVDAIGVAELLGAKLALPEAQRQGVILALGEFLAYALCGDVISPDNWQPLAGIVH